MTLARDPKRASARKVTAIVNHNAVLVIERQKRIEAEQTAKELQDELEKLRDSPKFGPKTQKVLKLENLLHE